MKCIDIVHLCRLVEIELMGQGLYFPKEDGLCKHIEMMHKSGEINLWDMTEDEIKLLIKGLVYERN